MIGSMIFPKLSILILHKTRINYIITMIIIILKRHKNAQFGSNKNHTKTDHDKTLFFFKGVIAGGNGWLWQVV